MQATASKLLKTFNQGTIKLIKITDGTGPAYDPGDPVPTPYDLDGTVRGVSSKYVDGTLVLESDLQVTAAVHAIQTPTLKDKVSIDGNEYAIIKIIKIPAAGTTITNIIIVR
jgi:hypothetical protein